MSPGVGCGAAILRDGRLLLVKRLKPPEAGHWSLPGGKVDFGERVEDAVRREIAEELGVEIALTRSLGFVEMLVDDQHWVSPIFLATIRSGEPINREPTKHEAIRWADVDAPPAPLAIAGREALARLKAERIGVISDPAGLPSAIPADADLAAWRQLPRDEQVQRLRQRLASPESSALSEATMAEIWAEIVAPALTVRSD